MSGRSFLDTNVLVYLYDDADTRKRDTARRLIADESMVPVVSAQVLGEFYVTVTRKLGVPMDHGAARDAVSALSQLPVVPVDADLVSAALDTCARHQLSYWDALIVEAAATSGCDELFTEDLADGATVRGVTFRNPFAA